MDQIMIGKFIAACRKEKKMTQAHLAEKLGISDRAVSKWETGKCMPDASLMPELCELLDISVNDLFNGRRVTMENYKEAAEAAMLQLKENEEKKNRMMLDFEIWMGIPSVITLVALVVVAAYASIPNVLKAILIIVGVVQFFFYIYHALKIETEAGYYKCNNCGNTYVPQFRDVVMAMHSGRSRKMKCPACGQKCWHKKVIYK
ncbi:helix-turn-helix transcriptional regulator [Ruminococcus sp.]|uniref:helix-turn-helix domain-containing protein n=1 Tax=Ruminococcus sp. TaxID=41978 RepID=UPI0025F9ACBF|nr:helix-turn-helix transcriptional regulator [Ruminococcus sp.]